MNEDTEKREVDESIICLQKRFVRFPPGKKLEHEQLILALYSSILYLYNFFFF